MRKTLLNSLATTLIVDVLGTWVMLLYLLSRQGSFDGAGLYFFMGIFGNMFIPLLATVLLFAWVKRFIDTPGRWAKYAAQAGFALLIMAVGVVFSTINFSVGYWEGGRGLSGENLHHVFDGRYKGWIPHIVLDGLSIPVVYYWVSQMGAPRRE